MARASGAHAALAHRLDRDEPTLWLSPALAEVVGSARPHPLEPPQVRVAIEKRISVLDPGSGPLAFARELCRVVVALGFAERPAVPAAVVWLGFAGEVARERLEGFWELLDRAADQERRFLRYFDHLPAVMIAVGLDGVVLDCNDRIQNLGFTRDEVIGRSGSSFFLPGERERLRTAITPTGKIVRQEVALRHRSGEVFLVDMMVGLVRDSAGQPVEIVAAGRDLREERRLEHDRRMEAVSRLISGVAHELNNPLLTVLGNAEMLAEAKLSGPARRRAERVLSGARRCQDVVDELLRLRLRPKELNREVDLEEVLTRAVSSVRGELDVHPPPQVELRLPPAFPPLRGDARDLEQAFAHILRNAFQAVLGMPSGHISVAGEVTERSVQITIQDNGPGMSTDVLDRAFEPFFTTREIGKGRGLGLPIALGILHDHGGHLELRSEQPGVRVQATLPLPR